MTDNRNSYGNILKSIGLFGGVQVFQIIVGIVRNKFAALLLGPAGMGVVGLITSTIQLIGAFSGLGLRTSAMRDIASATSSKDESHIGNVISVLRKLVIVTGLIGALFTFLFAKWLSLASFGSEAYTNAFRIVSVVLFLDQLCVGQTVLMQGTFHYKYMARSSLIGSVVGLLVSVPLYYMYGESAIVPVIIISSLSSLLLSTYFARKIKYQKIKLPISKVWSDGKGMIVLGAAVALSGVVHTGGVYVTRIIISNMGTIADVGLYTAGMAIVTQYVNVLLSAMSSDYAPRLSSMSNNKEVFIETINRQMKLIITMISPMILLFIILIREVTILLYSDKFLPISSMLEWLMLGMFFRSTSWCISYAQVAHGDSKTFFINEFLATVMSVILAAVGYSLMGFSGIGIAFFLNNLIYTIQMYLMNKWLFGYTISKDALQVCVKFLLFLFVCFIIIKWLNYSLMRYIVGICLFGLSLLLFYIEINKMVPIKEAWMAMKTKYLNK